MLLGLTSTACGSGSDRAASSADSIGTTGVLLALGDTSLEARTLQLLGADSVLSGADLLAGLAVLQQIADTSSRAEVAAPALLRLGSLKLRLFPGAVPDSLVTRRPDDFAYDEISASHLYLGREFRLLLERYPDSMLADDAAYADSFVPRGGECEGFTECYAEVATVQLGEFLKKYPDSRHAAGAVERATAELANVFAVQSDRGFIDSNDLTVATQFHDPAAVRRVIENYEVVVRQLRRDVAAPAFYLLADLWQRFQRVDLARDLYERLLVQPGTIPVDSVRARLQRLPRP